MFELERLEYENENLNWNNVLQRLELENNRRTFYLLGEVLLVMIGILLLMALVFLYVNRSRLRMRRLAKTDMLTGLFNRRFLEEWFAKPAEQKPKLIEKPIPETKKGKLVHKLNKQVMRVQYGYLALNHWVERKLDKQKMVAKKPETGPITLVMMDVDHFKQVNDTYGHVFGDVVLTGVAKCSIRQCVRVILLLVLVGKSSLSFFLIPILKKQPRWLNDCVLRFLNVAL